MVTAGSTNAKDAKAPGTFFLGRYRVVEEIGVGGMASVHLARMDGPGGFQKWVAIKRIHPNLVEDDQFVDMFLDEARIAAGINHANVAQVFDLGKDEGTYWIAMEYLHGEPLRELMRRCEDRGQLISPDIAARICADAAEGLHAAHELRGKNGQLLGLVHRDVTPHNLFITYDGYTKVVDFGIAKVADRLSETRAGTLKGKLAYMSPEQVRGQDDVDRTTDVFALGVVLYECLAGHLPFEGKNPAQVLRRVLEGDFAPADAVRPVVGGRYARYAAEALDTEPSRRPKSALALGELLRGELCALGIENPRAEIVAYLDDPEGYVEALPKRLVPRLLERGEAARRSGDVECAAADFNRAHALAPDDMAVLKRITQLGQRRDREVLVRRAGVGAAALCVLVGAGALGWWATRGSPARLARSDISMEGAALLPEPAETSAPSVGPRPPKVVNPRSTAMASALRAPPLKRVTASAQVRPAEPRSVRFVVQPRGAQLEVDGARVDHFGGTLKLQPGTHEARLSPPPGDPCCDAVNTSFRVLQAPEDEPGQVQSVPLSLRFRPATVRVANGPAGGMVTCGAFLSLGVGGSKEVTMTTAAWEGYCTFIGEGRSEQAFRTIRAGVSNALAWPNPS